MSSRSVAGAGNHLRSKVDSPGGEGASCGTCRRVDNSRMVQCDECDVWYHYDCVDVNDSVRNHDWSCNGCIRGTLEKQRRALSEQLEFFKQQQRQWQYEQQKLLEQLEEQQKLEQRQKQELQQRKQEQIVRMQLGQLQLQEPSVPLGKTTIELEVPLKSVGVIPKQNRQHVKIVEKAAPEGVSADHRRNTEPFSSSTAHNEKTSDRSDRASSKSSKRSAKLLQLEVRALEARQALEKKQLEERLTLERDMLEYDDSEAESNTSLEKISEWLEKTENVGQEAEIFLNDTPLPVYNEILRKTVNTLVQPCLPNSCGQPGPSTHPKLTGELAPNANFRHPQASGYIPIVTSCYQPGTHRPAVSGATREPMYSVASQPPIVSTAAPSTNYPQSVVQNMGTSQRIDHAPLSTSTPQQNLQHYLLQTNSEPAPLNSGHLAARQTVKDLPKFGGDPEDWPRFIAAFERTSRMCAFRNDELLDRLERSLHDKALTAVKSLLLLPENVPVIINRLKTLFGNPEFIVETMIQKVRMMPPPKADKLETIVDFGVAVQNLCATIQVCRMDERLYNVAILQELVDSLPSTLKMQWALYRKEIGTPTMLDFNNWLEGIVDALSQVIRPAVWLKSQRSDNKLERQARKNEAYLHVHSTVPPEPVDHNSCLACGNECSMLDECSSFLEMSSNARWALVNEKKICRKCLSKHFESCERRIQCNQNGCTYLHHWLLHDDNKHKKPQPDIPTHIASCNIHYSQLGNNLLKYIPVTLHGREKSINTYAFLDTGSTSTLIEHNLWEELNLSGEKSPLCISWTGGQSRSEKGSVVFSAEISGVHSPEQRFYLPEVHTVQNLDLPAQSMLVSDLAKQFTYLSGLHVDSYTEVKPQILLGVDNCRLEYPLDSREGDQNQPTAVLTRLGWVIYGPSSVTEETIVKEDLRECESFEIQRAEKTQTPQDENCEMFSTNAKLGSRQLAEIEDTTLKCLIKYKAQGSVKTKKKKNSQFAIFGDTCGGSCQTKIDSSDKFNQLLWDDYVLREAFSMDESGIYTCWQRWFRQYLQPNNRRTKPHNPLKHIQIENVVVYVDLGIPRNSWPNDHVIKVNRKDGKARSVTMQTPMNIAEHSGASIGVLDVGTTECTQEPGPCVLGGSVPLSADVPPLPTSPIRICLHRFNVIRLMMENHQNVKDDDMVKRYLAYWNNQSKTK